MDGPDKAQGSYVKKWTVSLTLIDQSIWSFFQTSTIEFISSMVFKHAGERSNIGPNNNVQFISKIAVDCSHLFFFM